MRHREYEKLAVLSLYDELEDEEKEFLQRHLLTCSECNRFRENLRGMFPRSERLGGNVDEQSLLKARKELHLELSRKNLDAEKPIMTMKRFVWRRWSGVGVPVYAAGAVALIMLAVGLLSGIFLFGQYSGIGGSAHAVFSQISNANAGEVAISDVRFLAAPKKGELRFSFNLTRRYVVDGSLDSRDVQKVLAFALVNSDNAGVRLRTIGMLDASAKPDPEIMSALVKAVETDENAGVRREALLSLEKLPFNTKIRGAFLFVLQNDKNPGMRVAAINFLAGKELNAASGPSTQKQIDPRVLEVLKERSTLDQNRYVRLKAADMLRELKEL